MPSEVAQPRERLVPALLTAALVAVTAWTYYPTILSLARLWTVNPNYSQGFLVPILALGLLFFRCSSGTPKRTPDPRLGLALLAIAAVMKGVSAYFFVTPLDHLSLLITLTGLCLLLGGRAWLKAVWPAIALLLFMFPIPSSLGGDNLTANLQDLATRASTFSLQTLGVPAAREGNIILLRDTEVGIVEACSGLRMLMVFCALAAVTAILITAGWPRKVILAASAIPMALCCNIIRITVAGVASESLGSETGHFIFHDLAGWLMVPMAFMMLGAELFVLSRLFQMRPPVGDRVRPSEERKIASEGAAVGVS